MALFPFSLKANRDLKYEFYLDSYEKASKAGHYLEAELYLDSSLSCAKVRGKPSQVGQVLLKKAFLFQVKAKYSEALVILFEAQRNFEKASDVAGLGEVFLSIGAIHHQLEEYVKAEAFYQKSLDLYSELGNAKEMARCYNNFGSLAEDMNKPDEALYYHRKCLAIWKSQALPGWQGISYMHLGVSYELLGKTDSAIHYLASSVRFMEKDNGKMNLALVYNLLGNVHQKAGHYKEATKWCNKGLMLAEELNLLRYQYKSCECLYNVYESQKNVPEAFYFYKKYITLRDSVFSEQKGKEITRIEMDHSFQNRLLTDSLEQSRQKTRKELEYLKKLNHERQTLYISIFGGLLLLVLAGGLWNRMEYLKKSRSLITKEKERSDSLLLNILPEEIAEELKNHGKSESRQHESVSILFLDVKDFTGLAEVIGPKDLVAEINSCFEKFDSVMEKYGVEKIKTIGDSYMAAGGIPVYENDSARKTVLAALEIQAFLKERKKERDELDLPSFEMRAGIHTGSVVAGIVGSKKFQYDIWGDAVNIASRMETSGEPGEVNISGSTFELLKDDAAFVFEHRGALKAKGKGYLEMYFVRTSGA